MRMQAVVFEAPGGADVLRWSEVEAPACGVGQVALRVRATAVNRADTLQRQGYYPPPPGASPLLGLEAAGVVEEVGEGVTDWRPGDEAMALLAGGGYAERVVVDARHLLSVPPAIGLPDAGAVPEVFLTAYLNLVEEGGLRSGERVLIHGGSGGVGTAAIQIARHLGAEVWTTAGGADRCERCRALGAHVAIDHRADDFAARLRDAGGADLVLDIIGAAYLDAHLRVLRPRGRLVVIGLQGGRKGELDLARLLYRRLTLKGSVLRPRSDDEKAGIVARFADRLGPALADGTLRPVIGKRLLLSDAAAAHAALEGGDYFGKILLELPARERRTE